MLIEWLKPRWTGIGLSTMDNTMASGIWSELRTQIELKTFNTAPDGTDHGKTVGRMMKTPSKFPVQNL